MFLFRISTGNIFRDDALFAHGYSGRGLGKNNPALCNALMGSLRAGNYGPLPVGRYSILTAENHPRLGPVSMRLIPDPKNQMFGRGGFFIHGDSITMPGGASEGCIVPVRGVKGETGREIRELIARSEDRYLQVIP